MKRILTNFFKILKILERPLSIRPPIFPKKMKFYLDYSEDYYSQNKEKYFNLFVSAMIKSKSIRKSHKPLAFITFALTLLHLGTAIKHRQEKKKQFSIQQ